MSCYQVTQLECNPQIDYSTIIIGDRIIPYTFELDQNLSVLNPAPGQNQRFCYIVTGVGSNITTFVSLSHWVLSLCPDITLDQITNIEVTIGGVPQTVIIGENVQLFIPPDSDPTTGCPGLKFDGFGLSKVLGDPNSVGLFCFELTTPYPVGAVTVCVKGGQAASSALAICGPVCAPPPQNCETTTHQYVDVCVPITVFPFASAGTVTTECCGPTTVSTTVPCEGARIPCTFFVSQTICVEVPVIFGATAVPGETFVECGEAAVGECVCPPPGV